MLTPDLKLEIMRLAVARESSQGYEHDFKKMCDLIEHYEPKRRDKN